MERREENKLLFEEILEHFKQSSEMDELVIPLPNGEYAVLTKKAIITEKLDKDSLAQVLLIVKDELKKPRDYVTLTERGRLTSDLVAKHTDESLEIKLGMRKRKTKPREKKKTTLLVVKNIQYYFLSLGGFGSFP